MDLAVMAMKEYSAFPKARAYWSLTIGLFKVMSKTLVGEVLPSAEMQLMYSTTPELDYIREEALWT